MRYEQLNLLRGYACLGVVLYHYLYHYFNVFNISGEVYYFSVGKFGVELFFILSGFLIHFSLSSYKTPFFFFSSRIYRLIPTYLVCLLITFFILIFLGDNYRQITPYDLLVNLLIFPSWFDGVFIDGSYWTLEYEWVFYIICGLTLMATIKLDKVLLLIIMILFSLCFLNIFSLNAIFVYQLNNSMFLNGYAPFFLLGVSLSYSRLIVKKSLSYILILCSIIMIMITSKYPIVSLFLIVIFVLAMMNRLPIKNDRFSLFLAAISYPFYLLHQCIGFIFIKRIESLGVHIYISITFTFFVLLFIAYFIHRLIEVPSINYFKKKFS